MYMYEPPLEPYFDEMAEWVHIDELEKFDDAKDYLKEVLNQFYNVGNINALESALEDLANIFEINLPIKEPKLVQKEDESCCLHMQFITSKINLPKIGVR